MNRLYIFAAVGILILLIVGLSLAPVPFGHVRAVVFAGGLTGQVFEQGLNFKYPWQRTELFNIQVKTYETGQNPNASQANFTDFVVDAQTSDGQQITIAYTVKFRVDPPNVVGVLNTYGALEMVNENVVKANSRSRVRKSSQNYEAGDLYSGPGILLFEEEVDGLLRSSFARQGITLDEFLIRKISFDPLYVDAIVAKQIAAENIVTQRNNALAAQNTAQQRINLAKGEADSVVLVAAAQAEAIDLQGAALNRYPLMTQWEFVRNLEGVEWGILPGEGITPLIPLGGFGD